MTEKFFERLREKANKRLKLRWPGKLDDGAADLGIDATIEALKEMVVGEPIKARARHYLSRYLPGEERTEYLVETEQGWRILFKLKGFHGTDGEEVAILAVRLS